ncbi:hypothetical protein B0H11DRAFT_2378899 [Mycena galericulata]|nr:hypothetical protein B0H11DRAFT_2378899 [Mycena galericulata]
MDSTKPHTRGATRAGVYPAPPSLFSPARISFGTAVTGDLLDLDTPAIDPSMSISAASAARNPNASASLGTPVTSVARPSASAAHTGDTSSELPAMLAGPVDWGVLGDLPAPPIETENTGGWTPVTRKTSRSHRERSRSNQNRYTHNSFSGLNSDNESTSESTVVQATRELSHEDREALARRYEAFAAQLRAVSGHSIVPESPVASNQSDVEDSISFEGIKGNAHEDSGSEDEPETHATPVVKHETRRATVEEVEDEGDFVSSPPVVGPSRNKGKGADPRNWGAITSLDEFSEAELEAQRDALENFAEITRIITALCGT